MESAPQTDTRPPVSEPLATLQAAIKRYQDGELADEAMQHALNDFDQRLQHLELPSDMPGTETGQVGVRQAVGYHQGLLTEYRAAFDGVQTGLSAGDADATTQAMVRMTHVDGVLRRLYEEINGRYREHQRKAEDAATVACPRCGTRNPRGQSSCKQCRFILPTLNERHETDITGGGPGDVAAIVQELRVLADKCQLTEERGPLVKRLEDLVAGYRLGIQRSETVLQAEQLDEEVRGVVRQTIDSLYGLIEAVEQAQALVSQGHAGSLDGSWAALEANLQDLDSLRAQFKELEQRFSS